eukprot:1591146-Pleurochrysis_carterae.AAC.1
MRGNWAHDLASMPLQPCIDISLSDMCDGALFVIVHIAAPSRLALFQFVKHAPASRHFRTAISSRMHHDFVTHEPRLRAGALLTYVAPALIALRLRSGKGADPDANSGRETDVGGWWGELVPLTGLAVVGTLFAVLGVLEASGVSL